jgi:hypothetical protein
MSNYNLTIKIIVSPTRIQDVLAQIGGHGYETLESFFSTLTGLAIESMGSSTGIERKEMYNHVSSRNGCHVYQVQFGSEHKEPLEAVFFNEFILKMLEAISPYVAHNTIAIYNGRKPLVSHEIHIGGNDFKVVRPELKRAASSAVPTVPPAPKKVKVDEAAPKVTEENLMDSMFSKFVLKLIIPDANEDQAIDIVKDLGYSSITNFFDALFKKILLSSKRLEYNEVSRRNGAHIFQAFFSAMADNFIYTFNKEVMDMIKAISLCCADDYLSLLAPVRHDNGLITYEPFNHYYIAVGRKTRFQYYWGEGGYDAEEEEEEEESVIEVVKEEADVDLDFTPNEVMNETIFSESFLDDKKGNDSVLLHVKAENQRIYDKIHARYEELLSKLDDLTLERDSCNVEIEITRRLIKELEQLV